MTTGRAEALDTQGRPTRWLRDGRPDGGEVGVARASVTCRRHLIGRMGRETDLGPPREQRTRVLRPEGVEAEMDPIRADCQCDVESAVQEDRERPLAACVACCVRQILRPGEQLGTFELAIAQLQPVDARSDGCGNGFT